MQNDSKNNTDAYLLALLLSVVLVVAAFAYPESAQPSFTETVEINNYQNKLNQTNTTIQKGENTVGSQINAMWIYIPSTEPLCAGIPEADKHEWTSTNNNTALFTENFLNYLIYSQIFDLFLLEANVSPGYENTFRNQAGVTALLNQLAAKDSRFHLWAWLATYPHSVLGQVDLSSPAARTTMINTMVTYAQMGFYGIQDDVEDITAGTTWANKLAYWNAEKVALNNIGVKCCIYTDNDDLSGIYVDYIFLAEWVWTQPSYNNWMKDQLTSADSPCLLGINCWGSGVGVYSGTFMAWADLLPEDGFSRLVGCAIYTDYALLASEWTDWNSWTWKNLTGSYAAATVSNPAFSVNPVEVNTPTTVSVSVSGAFGTPTGSVVFFYSLNNGVSWIQHSVKSLSSGAASSNPYSPSAVGTQLHKVVYSGNGTYLSGVSNSVPLTVYSVPPTPPPPAEYFYVHILVGVGGTTSPTGNVSYLVGQTASITATANQNYTFTRWLLNGAVYSTSRTIQITGTANTTYTLQPEFTYNTPPVPTPSDWTLTMSSGVGGSISPTVGSHTVTSLTQALTATASTGYTFSSWLIDGVTVETDNPYTLTATYGSYHTAYARFAPVIEPTPEPVPENVTPVFNNQSQLFTTVKNQVATVQAPTFAQLVEQLKKQDML